MSELNRLYVPAEHCKISLVVAMGLDRAIGERGAMPWYLPADLKHFKEATIDGCVIILSFGSNLAKYSRFLCN